MLKEEGRRIEMDLRAVETGGLSIGKRLVRPDMKSGKPCGRPGCLLDLDSGGAGWRTSQCPMYTEVSASSVERWR